MAALLRDGQPKGQRSEAIQSLALAAFNSGWTEAEFFTALMDPRNKLGDKVRELRDLRARHRYVSRSWDKAVSYAGASPAVADRTELLAEIIRIREAIEQADWRGVAGATDRRVMEAHLIIMERTGKLDHGASVREVAEITGRRRAETISASHERLRHGGWLRPIGRYRNGTTKATIWRAQVPPASRRHWREDAKVPGSSTEGVRKTVRFLRQSPLHDVFRGRGGLGLGPSLAYDRLHGVQPVKIAALGKVRSTWHRRLCRLEEHQLAIRTARGWLRGTGDPDGVAEALGVAGAGAKQKTRNARDREIFREHVEARAVGALRRS
jgi:hypothetical protein